MLELALRERLKDDVKTGKVQFRGKKPTLRALLKYAVDCGIVKMKVSIPGCGEVRSTAGLGLRWRNFVKCRRRT